MVGVLLESFLSSAAVFLCAVFTAPLGTPPAGAFYLSLPVAGVGGTPLTVVLRRDLAPQGLFGRLLHDHAGRSG